MVKEVILNGVGYKAYKINNFLLLALGNAHFTKFLYSNLSIKVKRNKLLLIGTRKSIGKTLILLGNLKKVEPYKLIGVQTKFKKTKLGKKR